MDTRRIENRLAEMAAQQDQILKKIGDGKGKDGWDKLGIISGLFSGVVLAVAGLAFTVAFQIREERREQEAKQEQAEREKVAKQEQADREQAEQRRADQQHRLAEMQTIERFLPHLLANDQRTREAALHV